MPKLDYRDSKTHQPGLAIRQSECHCGPQYCTPKSSGPSGPAKVFCAAFICLPCSFRCGAPSPEHRSASELTPATPPGFQLHTGALLLCQLCPSVIRFTQVVTIPAWPCCASSPPTFWSYCSVWSIWNYLFEGEFCYICPPMCFIREHSLHLLYFNFALNFA